MNRDEDVFAGAVALPPTERTSFLDRACEGDVVLRARVEALLNVHDGSPYFLEIPLAPRNAVRAEEKTGDVIGRYKLLQKIGEGGCGVVWMAEQGEPVRRRVALKVIKLGMDTKAVVARFEAERQALAIMDHPNIAKVHDAGATETGLPFFVMELVRGIPITKYCDENHLTPQARLELFIKVCQAVHHAHQKGIIHRDLKPSNILVTVNDGAPTPKVIDFGIAKATQGRLTDATVFTAFEQFIGTPVYMSPEQAEMSSMDIDTRSDIYSLGVMLYELLTGKPPFDPKALVQAGVDQIRQHIREIEPPTPSRRLHTLGEDERTTIARLRGTAPASLSLLLRGDLDWIVMRCLEKDRTRRYDTANGLAMDIQRHLRNEPVVARPPSTAYLLEKLIRRHRVGFAAAVAIVMTLAAGAIVSTWQAVRAKQAEARAETARRAEAQLRLDAETARQAEARLRHDAQRQEIIARERAYAADMNLVPQALADANIERARDLLDHHKPMPGQRDLRDWEWRYLWQFCQPDWESVLCENAGDIRSLSISGDGRWLAVAGGRLSVWNLMTRKELPTPLYGTGYVRVAFASRLPLLAAYTVDSQNGSPGPRNRVVLWNFQTGEIEREIALAAECSGLLFSDDSKTLAAATLSPDDKIILWNVADGSTVRTLPAPQRANSLSTPGTPFAATRDLGFAAHATPTGDLRVVDLNSGLERWVAEGADKGSVVASIAFSADGRFIASGAHFDDPTIRVWDAASGKQIQRLEGHRGPVFALLFWPDGSTLASASNDRTIRIWDVASGKQINLLRGHKQSVSQLELLSDNITLVSGARDGVACLWNPRSRRHEDALIKLPEMIGAWRFAQDGKSLLTARGDGRIVRWQGNGLKERIVELEVGPIVADYRMGPEQFSPDLRYVALQRIDAEGQVEVWDTSTQRLYQKIDAAPDIFPVADFRDDHTLRVFDQRGEDSIRCQEWDLRSGRVTHSWHIPIGSPLRSAGSTRAWQLPTVANRSPFLAVTFSADGDRCLISSTSRKSVVHNLRTGANEALDLDFFAPRFPQFSPDGSLLAAREVFDIKLWETATFREVATLPTVMRMPQSVAFSPNGVRLAVGSANMEAVILWNPRTHEPVLTLEGNGAQFIRTAFSPDGSRLGSRSTFLPGGDGLLHVWCAPTWEEIEAAEKLATPLRAGP